MEIDELMKYTARPGPTFFQLNFFVIGKEPTPQAKMHKCLDEIKDRLKSIDSVRLQIEETQDQNALYELEAKKLSYNCALEAEEREIRIRQINRKIAANQQHLETLNTKITAWQEEIDFLRHLFDQISSQVELKPWNDYDVQLEYWSEKMSQEIRQRLLLNAPVDMEIIKTTLSLPDQAPIKKQLIEYVSAKEKQLANT